MNIRASQGHGRGRSAAVVAAYLAVAGLNLWICWRLLFLEFHPYFHSIEGAFIGLDAYIAAHLGDLRWFPLWHLGMPFSDTYVPGYHVASALLAKAAGFSAARAYHAVGAVAYSLAPLFFALLLRVLGASHAAALVSAVVWSLFSASGFIMPGYAADMGNPLFSRRLQVMVFWGEGPHVSTLGLQCLALAALQRAFDRWSVSRFCLAALAVGLVGLVNVPGSMGLAIGVFSLLLAQERGRWLRSAGGAVACGAAAVAAIAWAVPPESIATILRNSTAMHPGFHSAGYGLIAVAAVAGIIGYFLDSERAPRAVRFALIELFLFAAISLTARAGTYELAPQGGRLHLEMDRAAAAVIGILLVAGLMKLPWRARVALSLPLLVVGIYQLQMVRKGARRLLVAAKIESRSEYQTARWVEREFGSAVVYATGSTAFWLNAFAPGQQQMTGCCDQGNPHLFDGDVGFLVNHSVTAEQVESAIDWLKLYGVGVLVSNTAASSDAYHDVEQPEKFSDYLEVVHAGAGDVVYRVLGEGHTGAYAVSGAAVLGTRPVNVVVAPERERLLREMGDPRRRLRLETVGAGRLRVSGNTGAGERVWIQRSFVPGWRVRVDGRELGAEAARADGLGLMVVDPGPGRWREMTLEWRPPAGSAAVGMVSLGVLGLLGAGAASGWRRRRMRERVLAASHG